MANQSQSPGAPRSGGERTFFFLGLPAILLFFVVSGFVSYLNTRTLNQGAKQVDLAHTVLSSLDDILSLLKDAETGQRGFLLTGHERYLAPYAQALIRIDTRLGELQRLMHENSDHLTRLALLREQITLKLNELAETIDLRRKQGLEAATAVVLTDRGKDAMDAIRGHVAALQQTERQLLARRLLDMDNAFHVAVVSGIISTLFGIVLAVAIAYLVQRAARARQREEWLLTSQSGLAAVMLGDKQLDALGDSVLKYLAERLDAQVGVLFARNGGAFRRVASYGVPTTSQPREQLDPGDGLAGQALKDRRTFVVRNLPAGYLTVGSTLTQGNPQQLLIAPFQADGQVNAVLELGFLHPLPEPATVLLERVSESVGVAVRSANYRSHLQMLLEETQRQTEELQSQSEELRVLNEELEEQSRALRESQSRLEHQQTELEQSNMQLEQQSQILETQRDELSRTASSLQVKAKELEQASQYKSDFLANMSHELRTPLNSSLILAKLLADNPQGNLSTEQVRYADTIRSAGNDLLALINDILDLSKIEAGHMELQPETVRFADLTESLVRTFEPLAHQKGLTFSIHVEPECPETIHTDRQRFEQVLKNLLSNALKFTERGSVALTVHPGANQDLAFTVSDTGIGIPEHQHQMIFEAFRQADGTTNRKYGGTGLGLSISRELARLLGGGIHLTSEVGRGSQFTVTIPRAYHPTRVMPRTPTPVPARAAPPVSVAAPPPPPPRRDYPGDDRQQLTAERRVILVIEDDESFAQIVYDLARELQFQCLIAPTADEGLALAAQHLPSAIVLDIGLPDQSGLAVLDRLKRDSRTRHIPVHVVSAHDYTQPALSLGAVAYMLKPVKREELADAFRRLEQRLAQRLRRVLVVEDDPVQLDSLQKLLGSHDVETVGVRSVAQCLDQLRAGTFDCMVLDLSLSDASGYSLLETLSREDAYSFPPAIVYTGRDLSVDEEQRLRRYSKSIIIKGAKSPERLLDEVTLFLHQVVADLPPEQQRMLEKARSRDGAFEGRRILVVEDDVRNVFALTSVLEPRGVSVQIARNGREALTALEKALNDPTRRIDLVLMDVMMPEMDGLTATQEIRKRPEWKKLPIIMLTAKAMRNDQERCVNAGANDYLAKPLDVEKLLSLIRVWMPR